MANPLKVLTALSASSGVAVSGSDGLRVQQGGLTVSAGNLSVSAGDISGSGALQVGGTATIVGGLSAASLTGSLSGSDLVNSSVANGKLVHSTVTVGTTSISLGGSALGIGGLTGLSGSNLVISGSQITASAGFSGNGAGLTGVIAAGVAAGSVALGTDTTGNYVADVSAGAGLKKTSSASATGQTVDLSIDAGTGINVTADGVSVKTGSVALSDGDLLKWDSSGAFAKSKITEDADGVSIAGNLTVSGFVTGSVVRIDTTNTVVKDQFLYLNSGSQGINGTEGGIKIAVSGASGQKEGQLSYVSGSGFKVTDGSITGAESTTSLTGLADFSAKALYFSASAASPQFFYSAGLNSVQGVIDTVASALGTQAILKDSFYGIRTSGYATKGSGDNVTFTLKESASTGADRSAGRSGQTSPDAILPQIQGLTSLTSSVVVDRLAFVSFDVATKAAGTSVWTNDLCSVEVSVVEDGGDYYPRYTVSAPALASGSLIRLIASWDDFDKIS